MLLSLILLGLFSCIDQKSKFIELPFEHDLIPEGIAIDSKTEKVYLNSLKKSNIVSSSLSGKNPETFLKSKEHGYLSGFGMTTKDDTLYALGNSLTAKENESVLLLLNLSSKELIESYSIKEYNFQYLNDLTISSKNEIFITDSESNKIYQITRPFKKLDVFLDSSEIPNSNGITISSNDKYLYLASTSGIRIVEIESKRILNKSNKEHSGIDGLKFYNNSLYGIVNGFSDDIRNGLFKYDLSADGTKILGSEKLVEFNEDFNIPTTFDIANGYIYFVVNTQLDNLDEKSNDIINPDKLEAYRMLKIKV